MIGVQSKCGLHTSYSPVACTFKANFYSFERIGVWTRNLCTAFHATFHDWLHQSEASQASLITHVTVFLYFLMHVQHGNRTAIFYSTFYAATRKMEGGKREFVCFYSRCISFRRQIEHETSKKCKVRVQSSILPAIIASQIHGYYMSRLWCYCARCPTSFKVGGIWASGLVIWNIEQTPDVFCLFDMRFNAIFSYFCYRHSRLVAYHKVPPVTTDKSDKNTRRKKKRENKYKHRTSTRLIPSSLCLWIIIRNWW